MVKIEIIKTDGTMYPTYIATQEEKIEFRELLEHFSEHRQQFVSAVVKYGMYSEKTLQGQTVEEPGARFETKDFDQLRAELGKFGV
jgi:hypothetical protein